jgi:hypothetical protein
VLSHIISVRRIKTEDLLELTRGDRRLALETVVGVLEGTSISVILCLVVYACVSVHTCTDILNVFVTQRISSTAAVVLNVCAYCNNSVQCL